MNQHPNNENKLFASSPVLDAKDPNDVGAFCEDALTEVESDESTAIPPEHLPEDHITGE
jgi:hypothetical protein